MTPPVRLLVACALAALALGVAAASAQQPGGRITGVVLLGGSGPLAEPLTVQLIVLGEGGVQSAQEATTEGGRFAFDVEADADLSYVVRGLYDGVQYLTPPVLLSPELPTAEVELVVYATTTEPPALSVDRTTVTVLRLDRANAQIVFLREDEVRNPGDRVFVGDEDGVTLRIPLPDGTLVAEAGGEGDSRVEGGTLAVGTVLRPGVTTVVSRYVVGYDRARDAYALRVTAPLPTDQMEVSVPTRFADEIRPLAGSAVVGERDASLHRTAPTSLRRIPAMKSTPVSAWSALARDVDGLAVSVGVRPSLVAGGEARGEVPGPDRSRAARGRSRRSAGGSRPGLRRDHGGPGAPASPSVSQTFVCDTHFPVANVIAPSSRRPRR